MEKKRNLIIIFIRRKSTSPSPRRESKRKSLEEKKKGQKKVKGPWGFSEAEGFFGLHERFDLHDRALKNGIEEEEDRNKNESVIRNIRNPVLYTHLSPKICLCR